MGVITDNSDIRKKLLENNLNNKTRAKDLMEKNFLFIPFKKKQDSKKILIESNKILIPITLGKKLIDYVHTSDFIKKKNIKKRKILVIGFRVHWVRISKNLLAKKINVNIFRYQFLWMLIREKNIKK